MTRFGRTLLTLLVVAFCATPLLADYVCGPTGFNSNLGVNTKSFRCAPRAVTRGVGTLTFNATSTVTASLAGFQGIVPPEAVPGADGTFFKASGLIVDFAGERYFLNVTAKASDSSITALLGAAAVSFSGTTTSWSFWNTVCLRSLSDYSTNTLDPLTNTDPRIWATSGLISGLAGNKSDGTYQGRTFAYTESAGNSSGALLITRPAGLSPSLYVITSTQYVGVTGSAVAKTVGAGAFTNSLSVVDVEFQWSLQSSAAATYIAACVAAPR